MNVADIKSRVKRQFGDESGVQITDTDIVRWINDAQRDIAVRNILLETKATTPTVAGTQDYTLPTDLLTLRAIRYDNLKLNGISMQEADELINSTDPLNTDSGSPNYFWIWAGSVSLYPVPAEVKNLTIYYTRQPVDISVDTDIPEIPIPYHNAIVDYCLQQAYELDENWDASTVKARQFETELNERKEDEKWTDRSFYPMITIRTEDL